MGMQCLTWGLELAQPGKLREFKGSGGGTVTDASPQHLQAERVGDLRRCGHRGWKGWQGSWRGPDKSCCLFKNIWLSGTCPLVGSCLSGRGAPGLARQELEEEEGREQRQKEAFQGVAIMDLPATTQCESWSALPF